MIEWRYLTCRYRLLQTDKTIHSVLGEHLFERYIDVKTKEWDEFKKQVTNWEIETYLNIF